MNSDDIYNTLEDIAAVSSTTNKQHILQDVIDDPLMLRVLGAACDPFTTYGVTAPEIAGTGPGRFEARDSFIWRGLESLAARNLTGNAAQDELRRMAGALTGPSFEIVRRILNRDLRCGITAKTINKLRPGTIRVFEVMLAHPFEEKRVKSWPVAVEPKLDGVRVTCIVKDGEAEFYSRTGKPFPAVAHLKPQMVEMVNRAAENLPTFEEHVMGAGRSIVLDGEIVAGSFNKTSGDVRRKSEAATDARYRVFDALHFDQFTAGKMVDTYAVRRDTLITLVGYAPDPEAIKVIPQFLAMDAEQVRFLYQTFRDRNLEGAIVKPLDGLYEKKRSHAWMKMKAEETIDLIVEDRFEGEGKYAGMLGGLIVDLDGVKVRVGGGFTDVQRIDFWEKFDQVVGRMIEIEFHERTLDGSLRHPRFVRFRDDKHEKVAA